MTKLLSVILSIIIIGGFSFAFADSAIDDQLEFAGTLEETLGHFWALEMNQMKKIQSLHWFMQLIQLQNCMKQ